jgi:uncharacterized protein with beta-barrel porin domain
MGGRKKLGAVGPLVLLASAATVLNAPSSPAADLTVTSSRTTAADTATGDGTGPGNIIVQGEGNITVTAPAAVTINSSHTVTNTGVIANGQESGASGILATTTANGVGTNLTSTISNRGTINVLGPASVATANPELFNAAINVTGLGTFTGNVLNDTFTTGTGESALTTAGVINVGGRSSYGMAIRSTVAGNVGNSGSISFTGTDSFGIMTTGRITGNLTHSGTITGGEVNAVGIYAGGGVDGSIIINGVTTLGTGSRLTTTNGINLITLDPLPAKAGLWVAADVAQGVLMAGNGITLIDEALDPATAAITQPPDSAFNILGGGPGVLFQQGGPNGTLSNITVGVGPDNDGYSFKTRGNILVSGSVKGLAASGITVAGTSSGGTNYTTILTGGIWNDKGSIQVATIDAQAVGVAIGNYGTVARFFNGGDLLVNSTDSTTSALTGLAGTKGGNAYGVLVDTFGTLNAFANSGTISVDAQGPATSAFGIADLSGTLTNFSNTGKIETAVQDGSVGAVTAVDLRANTSGVTFTNSGTIIGDIFLGGGNSSISITGGTASVITGNIVLQAGTAKTGNNTFTMNSGTVTGLVDLGNGTHTVSLSNGAKLGGLAQGTGVISSLTVADSQVTIFGSRPLNVSTAAFTGTSVAVFDINTAAAAASAILQSSGTVSFGANTSLKAAFTGILPDQQQTITVIKANSLVLGAPISTITTVPTSYINQAAFSLSPTDPNTLLLTARRRSAQELGFGPNTSAIYNAFATALNQDLAVVTAVSAIQTQGEFISSIRQLMPDSSGASLQAALNNQDMASGAIRRRLVGVAKSGMPDHAAGDVASFWAQAIGDYSVQDGSGEQAGYDIWGLGIAFGADMPVFDNTTNLGFAFTETWHSTKLNVSARSPVEFYNSQLHFYGRYNNDTFYVQGFGGGGYNSYNQMRNVEVGGVSRTAIGKWKGYQYGGSVETGYGMRFDAYKLTPFVRAAYLKNHENGYTEHSGGAGVDLTLAPRSGDSGRASAGVVVNRDFPIYYDSYIEIELRSNYTYEFKNDPYAVTAQFAVGGPNFTNFTNARTPSRANFGVGFAHKDSYSAVSVDYDTEIANGYMAHVASITARFRF